MERPRAWIAWLRRIPPERLLILLLALLAAGLWVAAWQNLPRPLEVVCFAVGDGDAFLIRGPAGRTVLLDGGSRSLRKVGERVLTPNLRLLGVYKLDAIIISHPDSDHLNGLPAVMEALPVGMLLDTDPAEESTAYQQVLAVAQARGIPHFPIERGDRLDIGRGARLRLLAPSPPRLTGTNSDDNNNSTACMLEYGKTRLLFTGDLEAEGEMTLCSRNGDLQADVLVAGHHGSRNSATDPLLDAVNPATAVISASGKPDGDHPHPQTLARLRARGIRIYRTDVHGQIRLRSDGREWRVRTFRKGGE